MAFSKQQVYFQTAGDSKKSSNHTGLAGKDVRGRASITTTAQNTSFKSSQAWPRERGRGQECPPQGPASVASECEGRKHLSGFSQVSVPQQRYSWERMGGALEAASGVGPPTTSPAQGLASHCPHLPASCAASHTPAPGSAARRLSNAAAPLISSTRGTCRDRGAAFSRQD